MAKNKLSRGIRILVDDGPGGTPRDLSADLVPGSLNGPGFTAGAIPMEGESDQAENVMADRLKNVLKAKFHANNTATTGASTVLNGIVGKSEITVTVQIGSAGAAPTTGDMEWSGEYTCLGAPMSPDGGKLTHDVEFQPYGSTPPAWDTVS